MAVNVLSTECEEDLECLVIPDFSYSGRAGLEALNEGFTSLVPAGGLPHPLALDYVRGNLFDKTQFKSIAPVTIGTDNDLNDIIDDIVAKSYAPSGVVNDPPMSPIVYAFGSAWSPKTPTEQDRILVCALAWCPQCAHEPRAIRRF
jgi:uncharacterized protein YukJ